MQEIEFEDLKEKETYIIERIESEKGRTKPFAKGVSEFEERFEFETQQLVTIIKIELPYFAIKAQHGREFIKLNDDYRYLKPSKEFLKALQPRCEDDF